MLKHSEVRIPHHMQRLPVLRGYIKPWFVKGDDFRIMDENKAAQSIYRKKCWICGRTMKHLYCFVGGPESDKSRLYSEPPCHLSCAQYAMQVCPFILLPRAKRRDAGLTDEQKVMAPGAIPERPERYVLNAVRNYSVLQFRGHTLMTFEKNAVEVREVWRDGKRESGGAL